MNDLFSKLPPKKNGEEQLYSAKDIEVLEGLEPVRRRPGMYVGGTDENALHHLVNELLDNSMDEAVAGFASRIEIKLEANGKINVKDNGRGIPIDPHPKFTKKSALEVILTTLHSGGKFNDKVYQTSGGLHGVGLSVVNALSDYLEVEVVRDKKLWRQEYSKGEPSSKLTNMGAISNRKGTSITFHPDPEIFDKNIRFNPKKLYQLVKSKAYLFKGVEIKWSCDPKLLTNCKDIPEQETIQFPGGLKDYLTAKLQNAAIVIAENFIGEAKFDGKGSKVEWAIGWLQDDDGFVNSYCNTIPTTLGGTHEQGFRNALLKGLKSYGEKIGNKKANLITVDDILEGACLLLSLFIYEPQFQGQTKEKLVSTKVIKLVENSVKDHFDHWLSGNKQAAETLLSFIINKAEERINRKTQKEINRKTIIHKIRLPGKLTDCTREIPFGTEIFLVEGDSAGGSAKQARDRETQAILPLRGKILNVASSSSEKIRANQELSDLELALGCGSLKNYNEDELRYEKVIIMTDADVDGAHISSLLMTFFFKFMPRLVENGHLYLAKPPLYRITYRDKTFYAQNEKQKEELIKGFAKNAVVDVGRFKGLGEMTAAQLKETTMNIKTRTLIKVTLPEDLTIVDNKVEDLMGRKAETRFQFILEQSANFGLDLDID